MRGLILTGFLAAATMLVAGESPVLRGRVEDSTGAAIVGARVVGLSAGIETVRDSRGEFTLALAPGEHTVEVVARGFEPARQLIVTAPGRDSRVFVLLVGSFQESVTVSEAASGQGAVRSATRTLTPLRDIPQSITVATREQMSDQLMTSVADVVSYVPGIATHQGENNRDQVVIRGNNSSADFFVNGVRDDAQYFRDLYNLERLESLKGPNAMIFGRGGGGGVINRVTKEAVFSPLGEILVEAGSYGDRRVTGDLGRPLSDTVAVRLNTMYQRSDSFRESVELERYGLNPTITMAPSARTKITVAYEHLHDVRVADRGIPSFDGRPAEMEASRYFGNPQDSQVRLGVDQLSVVAERTFGRLLLRTRALAGDQDRFYQNFVPGAVSADRQSVALSAYNNRTRRRSLFEQIDAVYSTSTGPVRHLVLAGAELGRQVSDNFRNTGFFEDRSTSASVAYDRPTIDTPVTFRQSATDADNRVRATVAAVFLQDQVELSPRVQLVAGLRFDRFRVEYQNNRNGDVLARTDDLISPRAGLVVKPAAPVSLYASYSVSHLPSAGDQFSSLTTVTQQVKPETFYNYEAGIKWDPVPALSMTGAMYRLDRTNTRSTDPNDPTRIVQTGAQRTRGVELGIGGRVTSAWRLTGGYAYQDAVVTEATTAARAGARVAQVPRHSFSLWNRYQVVPRLAAGVGVIHRGDTFAAIDNTVRLPGYVRVDVALDGSPTRRLRVQINVENILDATYYAHAGGNNNISPGSGRTVRLAVTTRF